MDKGFLLIFVLFCSYESWWVQADEVGMELVLSFWLTLMLKKTDE